MTDENKRASKLEKSIPVVKAFIAADMVLAMMLLATWFFQWWFGK